MLANYPEFFSSPDFLLNHFKSIALGIDLKKNAESSLESELRVMRSYLIAEGTPAMKKSLKADLGEEFTGAMALNILTHLAEFWEEPILSVMEVSTAAIGQRKIGEPHLVVNMGNFSSISLCCDRLEILKNLNLTTGFACLVALHFAGFMKFTASNVKYFITHDLCHFALNGIGKKKESGTQTVKLRRYHAVKQKHIGMVYNDQSTKFMFGKRRSL